MSIDGEAANPTKGEPKQRPLIWALPKAALITIAFVVIYKASIRSMPTTSAIAVLYVVCLVGLRAGYKLFQRRPKDNA
jgi:hypothetical protein